MERDDFEVTRLKEEVRRLEEQIRDLRMVVATIHPEFFGSDEDGGSAPRRRHLRIVEGMGVVAAFLFAGRKVVKPAAAVAALGGVAAGIIFVLTLTAPAMAPRTSEPAPYPFHKTAAGLPRPRRGTRRRQSGNHDAHGARIAHHGAPRRPVAHPSPRPTVTTPPPTPTPTHTSSPAPTSTPTPRPTSTPPPKHHHHCVTLLGIVICTPLLPTGDVSGISATSAVADGITGYVAALVRFENMAPDLRVRPCKGLTAPAIGLEPITCRVAGARAATCKDAVATG